MKKTLCLVVLVTSIITVITTNSILADEINVDGLRGDSGSAIGTVESVGQDPENKIIGDGSAEGTVDSCHEDQSVIEDAEVLADRDAASRCSSGQISRISEYQTTTQCRKIPWEVLFFVDAQATYLCK
jgi:hypothetical protein